MNTDIVFLSINSLWAHFNATNKQSDLSITNSGLSNDWLAKSRLKILFAKIFYCF